MRHISPIHKISTLLIMGIAIISVKPISANGMLKSNSIEISSSSKNSYAISNLQDKNLKTAWCIRYNSKNEHWLIYNQSKKKKALGIWIVNGYRKSKNSYTNNHRAKEIEIVAENRYSRIQKLADGSNVDWVGLPKGGIKILFNDVHVGRKYEDLCLTEVITDFDEGKIYSSLVGAMSATANSYENVASKYGEIIERKISNKNSNWDKSFWNAIKLSASLRDDKSLRLLLDLSHYAHRISSAVDVDLAEGINNIIMQYIIDNPHVVIGVAKDARQLERKEIVAAYDSLISNLAYNPKTGEIIDELYDDNIKKLGEIVNVLRKEHLGSGNHPEK